MRSSLIDCLRFIGLSLIILAHMPPPYILFNLRCFDVPMMLFVSGMAYSNRPIDFSILFFVRRLLRLIIPVYIFLTVYFFLVIILKFLVGIDLGINMQDIIGSYVLIGGIGYVWIIRVFLLISFLTPILMTIEQNIHNDTILFLLIVGASVLLSMAIHMGIGGGNLFVREYVYYAAGYSIPFIVGLRVMHMRRFHIFFLLIAIIMVLLCSKKIWEGERLLEINALKYPPQTYFLFYGLFVSLVCYKTCSYMHLDKHLPAICRFIGMNSIWIYLYHIPLVQITGTSALPWWIRYFLVYAIAVIICYIQVRIVQRLRLRHDRAIYKYLEG